jgi:hypothetical protein
MNDINLLRYHNRSASEIHMLLAGESADKLFSRLVLGEDEQRTGRSLLVLSLTMAASFACALFASYVIYKVVITKDIVIPTFDKAAILQKVEDYKEELRTGGDPYLKDGFSKIANIAQSPMEDNASPVTVESQYKPPISVEKNPELFIQPVPLEGEPVKRKRDKRVLVTPMFTGNFAIEFRDINEADAAKVRLLAENNDFKLNIIGSTKKSTRKWNIYKEDDNSRIVIAGKNVKFVKTFQTRSAAVEYMQKHKIAGVVSSDTTYYDYYDMEVCCLGDEAAEKLARGSGINMNKIKILKK